MRLSARDRSFFLAGQVKDKVPSLLLSCGQSASEILTFWDGLRASRSPGPSGPAFQCGSFHHHAQGSPRCSALLAHVITCLAPA